MHPSDLTVAASFTYPYEADFAKALLESHDVDAWVLDGHQIQTRWHFSGALGGVKVSVRREDLVHAKQILAEDRSEQLETIPESALPAHPDEVCPSCGGTNVISFMRNSRISGRTWLGLLISLLITFIVPLRTVKEDWRCRTCSWEWEMERSR